MDEQKIPGLQWGWAVHGRRSLSRQGPEEEGQAGPWPKAMLEPSQEGQMTGGDRREQRRWKIRKTQDPGSGERAPRAAVLWGGAASLGQPPPAGSSRVLGVRRPQTPTRAVSYALDMPC